MSLTRKHCEHGLSIMECLVCISPTKGETGESKHSQVADRIASRLKNEMEEIDYQSWYAGTIAQSAEAEDFEWRELVKRIVIEEFRR